MEDAIDQLRENYNPKRVMVGFVSSVQSFGVFVSVIDGQVHASRPFLELSCSRKRSFPSRSSRRSSSKRPGRKGFR